MPTIRRAFIFFLLLLIALFASQASAQVVRVNIDDTIHPMTDEYIGRSLDRAKAMNADVVIIQLRTPGGLVNSTRSIVEKILASPVPVVVYVAPSGAHAASAGFYILQAADIAAMAPGTNTGAAHPVTIGAGKMDDVMKSKIENDVAAFLRSYVSKRGRNAAVAETAVRESKSFTEQEALSQQLIDIVAADEKDLLKQLEGREVRRFNGTTATLHVSGKPVEDSEMSLKQRILGFLMNPNITFIVLAIGALALYFEFNNPGAILPGVVGALFILLAAFALNLLPTRFAALALILLAFILFGLEAKFTSHGILGTGGIVSLTLGALLLVDGPIPEMRVRLWTALAVSVPLGVITIFLMTIALRAHRNKVITGEQGLVGEIGVARSDLNLQGKVFVHGELWDAHSSSPIASGDSVVVERVNGMLLDVRPAHVREPASAG